MKKEDWIEGFEAIYNRKPTEKEIAQAEENGEILSDKELVNKNAVYDSELEVTLEPKGDPDNIMSKEDWIEAFEAIYSRKPTDKEIAQAEENGEIDSIIEKVGKNTVNHSEYESVLESESKQDSTNQKYNSSNQGVFCQFCGQKNGLGQQNCQHCGKVLGKDTSKKGKTAKGDFISYLLFCIETNRWGILIYCIIFGLVDFFLAVFPLIIALVLTSFLLTPAGQTLICKLLGARKIERSDYAEQIQKPIEKIILRARKQGLNLPDNIEIRVVDNDLPIAYAVGMNRIIVSESLLRDTGYLEYKIMYELHRIHEKAPNVLLIVVGMNIFLILLGLIVMFLGGFTKDYGDRRKSFFVESEATQGAIIYYIAVVLLIALITLMYIFVKSIVKRDIYDSDRFITSIGFGKIHCFYLDTVSVADDSRAKNVLELGYPKKDKRIAIMQNELGVNYSGV